VVKNGFSYDLADRLCADLRDHVKYLKTLSGPLPDAGRHPGFHH